MAETSKRFSLWAVEVFIATADEGSVSAAATRLGASPSAVSQQISNLETALGATLMDRAARPVTLTPAGEIFRPRAQAVLHEASMARIELAGGDFTALTKMRLGMIEDLDADVTPVLLTHMAKDFPKAQFLLETGASHWLYDQLEARALDMVVTADTGEMADWTQNFPLFQEPFVAAVPADLAGQPNVFQDLPLIQYTSRHVMGRQIATHLARQNMTPSHRFELDSYHAILAMVAAGQGWAILTPLGISRAQRFIDNIAVVPLPIAPLTRRISLTARRDDLGSVPQDTAALVQKLVDEIVIGPAHAAMPWLCQDMKLL